MIVELIAPISDTKELGISAPEHACIRDKAMLEVRAIPLKLGLGLLIVRTR